jgi:hypothetical protein
MVTIQRLWQNARLAGEQSAASQGSTQSAAFTSSGTCTSLAAAAD